MKILILHGPNLALLGSREVKIYGKQTLSELEQKLKELCPEDQFIFKQENHEGVFIDHIHEAQVSKLDAIILNPGGFTHSSVAICDALRYFQGKKVEVHLSNTSAREPYRKPVITSSACDVVIEGAGILGYELACEYLKRVIVH